MKKSNFIILIIFILFSIVGICKPDTPDFSCLNNIVSTSGIDVSGYSKFAGNGSYNFCGSSSDFVQCDPVTQNIKYVKISASSPKTSISIISDLFCFKELKNLTLGNFQSIDSNSFFSVAESKGLTTINILNGNGVSITQSLSSLSSLSIQTNDTFTLSLSYITVLKKFNYDSPGGSGSIAITNDLSASSKTSFDYFNLTIGATFPDLSYLNSTTVQIKLTPSSNKISFSNVGTLLNVKNLVLLSNTLTSSVSFPTSITSITGLVSFTSDLYFTTLTSLIDLSTLTSLKVFNITSFISSGSVFTSTLGFPISKFPTSLDSYISVNQNSKFVLSQFSSATNLKTIVMRNNFFGQSGTGSTFPSTWTSSSITNLDLSLNSVFLQSGFTNLDKSYCSVYLKIAGDGFSSLTVPSCYSCHFGNLVFKSNVIGTISGVYTSCTTLVPNAYPNKNNGLITIYGSDMGFDGSWISSTLPGNTAWVVDTMSQQLHTNNNYIGIFNITYSSTMGGNQTFTLTNDPKPPIVTKITPTSTTLTIDGSYFSYNLSIISVVIGGTYANCTPTTGTTFYQITCLYTKSLNPPANVSYIKVGDLQSSFFTIDLTKVNTYNQCPNNCTGNGLCNESTSICSCYEGFEGSDCSIKECPVCHNGGSCNTQTGACSCIKGFSGDDCSLIECSQTCQNGGACNKSIGECSCPSNYADESCSTPVQYISSVLQINSTSDGYVNINIYGWFGLVHNDNSVYIGNSQCNINSITESLVECKVIQGEGQQVVNMTQNGISAAASFFFSNPIKTCPNNCNNHGQCNSTNGLCTCSTGYQGFDCAVKNNTDTPGTSIEHGEGNTSFLNENSNFTISVVSLDEISIDKKVIISHPLSNNWGNKSYSNNIYTFTQKLIQNNNANITLNIEEITVAEKQFSFAGDTFTLKNGSLKISISIKNYTFQSSLNTLELVFLSSVQSESQCNQQDFKVDNINNLETSNYITISRDKKTLYGSFYKKVVSDDRPTFSPSTVVQNESNSSVIVRLSLPHCTQECLIDPDFSLLVDNDFESTCDSGRPKWLLPVAIVVPCVGLAAIIIVSSIIYKKHKIQFKVMKVKLKELNKST